MITTTKRTDSKVGHVWIELGDLGRMCVEYRGTLEPGYRGSEHEPPHDAEFIVHAAHIDQIIFDLGDIPDEYAVKLGHTVGVQSKIFTAKLIDMLNRGELKQEIERDQMPGG